MAVRSTGRGGGRVFVNAGIKNPGVATSNINPTAIDVSTVIGSLYNVVVDIAVVDHVIATHDGQACAISIAAVCRSVSVVAQDAVGDTDGIECV